MLPFEFIVEGPPVSHQTKNRVRLKAWKSRVRYAAEKILPTGTIPVAGAVTFTVTYFYENDSPDVDNIIKPIQDALIGLIYVDDDQIMETSSRKKDINGAYKIRGASPIVIEGFLNGSEFLHIAVRAYQNNQQLI